MSDLGKRIRSQRESLQLTQEELAKKLGYKSKTSIAKIENGTNDIVQSKVCEFATALQTTPAYLMGWTDDPHEGTVLQKKMDPTKYVDSNGELDIAKYFKELRRFNRGRTRGTLSPDNPFSKLSDDELHEMIYGIPFSEQYPILKSVRSRELDLSENNVIGHISLETDPFSFSYTDGILGTAFSIYAKDDSMSDLGIDKGDLLIFDTFIDDEEDEYEDNKGRFNHSTVLASINGKESIVRKLIIQDNNLVILEAHNKAFLSQAFTLSEFNKVQIIAKYVFNIKPPK